MKKKFEAQYFSKRIVRKLHHVQESAYDELQV